MVPAGPGGWSKAGLVFVDRHPLFPLLALLFEKCEQSTLSSDCITSASFDVDIENFVRCQEKEGNPFFSEDPELDNLVSSSAWGELGQSHHRNSQIRTFSCSGDQLTSDP